MNVSAWADPPCLRGRKPCAASVLPNDVWRQFRMKIDDDYEIECSTIPNTRPAS